MHGRAERAAEALQGLGIEEACKIDGEMDPEELRKKLKLCTDELVQHVANTETKRTESQEKNNAYMKLKTTISGILKNLKDSKEMSKALEDDKNKVLATLHAQAKKTEDAINNLHTATASGDQ